MNYSHTQSSPMHWIVGAFGLAAGVGAVASAGLPVAWPGLAVAAVVMLTLSFCFARLTVEVDEERLSIRYGPLPWFGAEVRLDEVTAVAYDRTNVLDGWGVHWVPGRGWTYNLWGFDCVRLELGNRTIRVGTDDPSGLLDALERRLARPSVAA